MVRCAMQIVVVFVVMKRLVNKYKHLRGVVGETARSGRGLQGSREATCPHLFQFDKYLEGASKATEC